MTHRVLLRMVVAAPMAAMLISCGGTPTATGPAAQQQAVDDSQASDAGAATSPDGGADPTTADPTTADATTADGGARPGGPEPGTATDGGARPGGPFDVEAFENRGENLADFRPFGAEHCAGGRCVLVEQTSTDPDAQEGCEIADFAYDPPAQPPGAPPADQFIQRGTTVTVFVHCPPAAGESGAGDSGAGDSGAASSSSGDSGGSDSSAPAESTSDPASESPSDSSGG